MSPSSCASSRYFLCSHPLTENFVVSVALSALQSKTMVSLFGLHTFPVSTGITCIGLSYV